MIMFVSNLVGTAIQLCDQVAIVECRHVNFLSFSKLESQILDTFRTLCNVIFNFESFKMKIS